MSLLRLLLNVLWILTGGLWMAVGWLIAAVLMVITIVGLPWARAAFNIASYTLLPFGRVAVPRDELEGRQDLGTGPLGTIGNVLWLVLAGWWLALGHLITAIGLAITIIGIPFAWAHLKLATVAVAHWQDHRDHRGGREPSSTQSGARPGRVWRPKSRKAEDRGILEASASFRAAPPTRLASQRGAQVPEKAIVGRPYESLPR